ncbi:MAG: hypothetical protein KDA84_14630, partial [Planctomycetaceae bacterium]|nr:hypothetical protein [Planctomycetaceae bacterium]
MMCETLCLMMVLCTADPNASAAVVERTDASRLGKILKTWEVQSHQGKVVQIEFIRFVYDNVFQVEKRAKGRLIFGEGKYRFDLNPCQIEEGKTSHRKDQRTKQPFKLQ